MCTIEGKKRHYSGNRHCSSYCHSSLFPSVPRDFTGTISGNRHYSTGTIEGPQLQLATFAYSPQTPLENSVTAPTPHTLPALSQARALRTRNAPEISIAYTYRPTYKKGAQKTQPKIPGTSEFRERLKLKLVWNITVLKRRDLAWASTPVS